MEVLITKHKRRVDKIDKILCESRPKSDLSLRVKPKTKRKVVIRVMCKLNGPSS